MTSVVGLASIGSLGKCGAGRDTEQVNTEDTAHRKKYLPEESLAVDAKQVRRKTLFRTPFSQIGALRSLFLLLAILQ